MNLRIEDRQSVQALVAAIPDPEIPVITIEELGILRDVILESDGCVRVKITPTYSGCPAMNTIEQDIMHALAVAGFKGNVELILNPPWTSDSITERGRNKLLAYGIAPPIADEQTTPRNGLTVPLFVESVVACPRCASKRTKQVSAFGATACKEQWRCDDCHEPFEYFKCHR